MPCPGTSVSGQESVSEHSMEIKRQNRGRTNKGKDVGQSVTVNTNRSIYKSLVICLKKGSAFFKHLLVKETLLLSHCCISVIRIKVHLKARCIILKWIPRV